MENLNKHGYILNDKNGIEKLTYKEYLESYGADETTTPKGVAPRLFIDGCKGAWGISSWGVRGNNLHQYSAPFKTKKEAKNLLYECFKNYIENYNWDAPRFFWVKKDLYEDLSAVHQRDEKIIKRYFKILEAKRENLRLSKIKYDNRPLFTKEMMLDYMEDNQNMIKESLEKLDALKDNDKKELWQVKANALIQKISNNDFRALKWKEIYNLARNL